MVTEKPDPVTRRLDKRPRKTPDFANPAAEFRPVLHQPAKSTGNNRPQRIDHLLPGPEKVAAHSRVPAKLGKNWVQYNWPIGSSAALQNRPNSGRRGLVIEILCATIDRNILRPALRFEEHRSLQGIAPSAMDRHSKWKLTHPGLIAQF